MHWCPGRPQACTCPLQACRVAPTVPRSALLSPQSPCMQCCPPGMHCSPPGMHFCPSRPQACTTLPPTCIAVPTVRVHAPLSQQYVRCMHRCPRAHQSLTLDVCEFSGPARFNQAPIRVFVFVCACRAGRCEGLMLPSMRPGFASRSLPSFCPVVLSPESWVLDLGPQGPRSCQAHLCFLSWKLNYRQSSRLHSHKIPMDVWLAYSVMRKGIHQIYLVLVCFKNPLLATLGNELALLAPTISTTH